jgi:hypothetical protein
MERGSHTKDPAALVGAAPIDLECLWHQHCVKASAGLEIP